MAVAKTYAKMEISGEPFKENGRAYVNVITTKGLKKVRWYSDAEYARMYPREENKNDIMDFNARHAFGFNDLGYITLYKGDEVDLEAIVDENHDSFRRNLTFGYYTPSHLAVPELPHTVVPVRLYWSDVMDHDDKMKPHDIVKKYVDNLLILDANSTSKYQGAENEWLQKTVKVTKKSSKENHFGTKHTYTLEDSEGNLYVWETGARDYPTNASVSLKMKVKEHKEINGEQCTVVWYCKQI